MSMNGYQFIAALFQSLVSLAWPAAFAFAVWLFREKLNSLAAAFLAQPLSNFFNLRTGAVGD